MKPDVAAYSIFNIVPHFGYRNSPPSIYLFLQYHLCEVNIARQTAILALINKIDTPCSKLVIGI